MQLERAGVATGIDLDELVETARWLAGVLGRELDGYVYRAGAFRARRRRPARVPSSTSRSYDSAELLGDPDRGDVRRRDQRDNAIASQFAECVVAAGDRGLGRVALVPAGTQDRPPDLEFEVAFEHLGNPVRPALGIPEEVANAPQKALVLAPNHAEKPETVPVPVAEQAVDPGGHLVGRERCPAEIPDYLGVAPHLRVAVHIAVIRLSEDEPLGLEAH